MFRAKKAGKNRIVHHVLRDSELELQLATDLVHERRATARVLCNRPARVLSDGTVEAETDEGWMRFENLEHLDEYLEATAPTGRA